MSVNLHDNDFYAWSQQQAHLLKSGHWEGLDIVNLVEEIEDMGGSVWRQLESRLEALLLHLLKWQYQPNFRGRSWQLTIKEQRLKLERLIRQNPSIKPKLLETITEVYPYAVVGAAKETGFEESVFPSECPYSVDDLFNYQYLPD